MDTNKNLKKSTKTGLMISLILVLLGIIYSVYTLITGFIGRPVGIQLHIGIVFLEYILVAFYALIGYKKPHGNILKYTMFAFVLLCMYEFLMPGRPITANIEYIANACIGLAAVMIAYMSGRLDRVDQNKLIMIIVGVMFVASIILMGLIHESFSWDSFVRSLSLPICWAALCLAYTARFEEHKAAGLEESK